jgi:two-component system chemotaxis sensor kinase CheA
MSGDSFNAPDTMTSVHGYLDNVGHELKTPLNAINALSSLLLLNDQNNLTEAQLEQLEVIHRSGETLTGLIDELVSLFRLRDTGLPINVDELSVHSLVQSLQAHFNASTLNKSVYFSLTVDPQLPSIETDNQKLLKILRNLLDNAIRFTDTGSISIEILGNSNTNYPVLCRVSDTGIGIPHDKFDLIWDAFRQLNESIKRQHSGLGLGLTIAKGYTHLLGGEISLTSEVGKGSIFTVKLPKSPLREEPNESVSSSSFCVASGKSPVTPSLRTESCLERAILLVDDDYRNQYAMKAMIEEVKGTKVLIAQDGVQALQLLKDHPEIQLVITDIAMPEMDGYDLIHHIRENKVLAYLPIIAVTAMPETDKDKILSSGANAYLRKPITMDQFFHLLKDCKDAQSDCA